MVRMRDTDLGFGKVSGATVDATFEKMHFCEDHLVVQALELCQEGIDQRKGWLEL